MALSISQILLTLETILASLMVYYDISKSPLHVFVTLYIKIINPFKDKNFFWQFK
jgi:hypothetical protein